MKRFLMMLLALTVAMTVIFTGVYADNETAEEPVTENVEVIEEPVDEQLPIEEETGLQVMMTLNVNLNGSAEFISRQYLDDEMYSLYEQMADQLSAQYEQMGMKVELGDEGGKKYVDMISEVIAGDPISFSPQGATDSGYRFAAVPGFFGTKYFVTASYDFRQSIAETPVEEAQAFAQLTMNLPVGASYSDANLSENGNKTLIWNIAQGRMNSVTVMFTAPNVLNIAILIGLLVILALVVVFIALGKKKPKLTDAELVQDALNHIEGETDDFVDDPFAAMTDEEINMDIEDEPIAEEITEDIADEVIEEAVAENAEEETEE